MLKDELLQVDGIVNYRSELVKKLQIEPVLILFGAGIRGQYTYRWIEKNVPGIKDKKICFIDNDPAKQGTILFGRCIKKPAEFSSFTNAMIVITTGDAEDVLKQLRTLCAGSSFRFVVPDIDDIVDDFSYIHAHQSELEAVYELLGDEKSRCVFKNLLNYRLGHEGDLLKSVADACESQYFDTSLIHFSAEDVFVDCGSFIGDTVDAYLKLNQGKYRKILTIEADKNNFELILDKYKENPKISCVNRGVWNESTKLSFDAASNSGGAITEINTNVSGGGAEIVSVDTIDHIVSNEHISFLKMDIEGAEVPALLGAYQTIRRDHPTLMICVYHKQDDFVRIPMLIKAIYPEYRLYFRHYRRYSIQETVCYAIADE